MLLHSGPSSWSRQAGSSRSVSQHPAAIASQHNVCAALRRPPL
jgi:hypothetical protein